MKTTNGMSAILFYAIGTYGKFRGTVCRPWRPFLVSESTGSDARVSTARRKPLCMPSNHIFSADHHLFEAIFALSSNGTRIVSAYEPVLSTSAE